MTRCVAGHHVADHLRAAGFAELEVTPGENADQAFHPPSVMGMPLTLCKSIVPRGHALERVGRTRSVTGSMNHAALGAFDFADLARLRLRR